jgi:hypothetical protein
MGISIRAYGRYRGVSDAAVRKAIKAGRVTPEPDGTIDSDKADTEWHTNTYVAQQRGAQKRRATETQRKAVPQAALNTVSETLTEHGTTDVHAGPRRQRGPEGADRAHPAATTQEGTGRPPERSRPRAPSRVPGTQCLDRLTGLFSHLLAVLTHKTVAFHDRLTDIAIAYRRLR